MASKIYPRQPSFAPKAENWGKVALSDGSTMETRVILCDVVVNSEDLLGVDVSLSYIVAMRIVPSNEMIKETQGLPTPPPNPPPPTPDAGYEKIEITKIDKITESIYTFEDRLLTLKLEMQAVARNMQFRVPSGAPLYHVRWNISYTVTKA
jgi:hypothetical protein